MIGLAVAAIVGAPAAGAPAVGAPAVEAPTTAVTPVAERVARLAALNKRNGQVEQFDMKPGGAPATFGPLTIRLRTCETTPPWEAKQTAAFVQIDEVIGARGRQVSNAGPRRIFSGWMFAESPSLNPLAHPLYDVWVKSCTMRFPGSGADTVAAVSPPKRSRAPKSPAADSASPN